MLRTLAVSGYRSLRDVVVPLGPLTVVTGGNGTGKSSLYRALRLLGDCGQGRVIGSLAREGGLQSALWAGPETLGGPRRGYAVEGTTRSGPVSMGLGFAADDLGYLVDLGLPVPSRSQFDRDPEIKREVVFAGEVMRPATTLADRTRPLARARGVDGWETLTADLPSHLSMLTELADPVRAPELVSVREQVRGWRFYDGFRVDAHSPARQPQVGTRTPTLSADGSDLAAAVATTIESGSGDDLAEAVADAFDGSRLEVVVRDGLFDLALHQPGMLRPLRAAELSDGTLRHLLWATALTAARPAPLVVLNEPETSLHPELLPALGRLVTRAAERTQVVVVSHSDALLAHLDADVHVRLTKDLGETVVEGQGRLDRPPWSWGSR